MTDPGSTPDGFARLAELARDAARAAVAPELHQQGRARWIANARLVGDAAPVPRLRKPVAISLALATAALCLGLALFFLQDRPLTYEVRGGQQLAANYVDSLRNAPASVEFSDGSQIAAAAGARLRIDSTHSHGARVFIEHGSATARVKHRARSQWVFVAGPFDVRVTGTRFTLAWDPEQQAIDLTLHDGSVEVQSPLGSSRCVVRSGQHFRASLSTGTMQLENSSGAPSLSVLPNGSAHSASVGSVRASDTGDTVAAPVAAPSVLPGSSSTPLTAAKQHTGTPHKSNDVRPSPWSELVRQGDFQGVVDAAAARGIDSCLRSGSADDVRALADAARYTRHVDLAERSLSALRSRFAGTRQSAAATFLLGRTYESSARLTAADDQYQRYLDESPHGEFAAEALAGHMRMVAATQSPVAAKPIALEYLRRYREGVHAQTARHLASER
jgi:hypothetical protein